MSVSLSKDDRELYESFLDVAKDQKLCLVGGCIRDLILGVTTKDLDFMIEKELEPFLNKVIEKLRLESGVDSTASHSRFFTAKLNFKLPIAGHKTLDFSQARKEVYPTPAARPVVFTGSIEEDILRRDFTINSIAIFRDQFIDLTNGRKDIETKVIRIHHDDSFRDDPIRLIRAVRFSERLGFSLEQNTLKCFQLAVKNNFLQLVSPRRRYEELKKVLNEPKRDQTIRRLDSAGLLKVLCPAISISSPKISEELDIEGALLSLVDRESLLWGQYVDSLGLPKEDSKRLKGVNV